MTPEEFRRRGYQTIDWIARYLERLEEFPVMSRVKPGEIREQLPPAAPEAGEPFAEVLADLERIILPGITVPRDYVEVALSENQYYLYTSNWRSAYSRLHYYGCLPAQGEREPGVPDIDHATLSDLARSDQRCAPTPKMRD